MGLGGVFRRLLGGGGEEELGEPVPYNGYLIYAKARARGGQYHVAGVIAKDFPDGTKRHTFLRADTFSSRDEADKASLIKARLIVDEQGDALFRD